MLAPLLSPGKPTKQENFEALGFTFQPESEEEEASWEQQAADHGVADLQVPRAERLPAGLCQPQLRVPRRLFRLFPLLPASGGQRQPREEQVEGGDPGARQVAWTWPQILGNLGQSWTIQGNLGG